MVTVETTSKSWFSRLGSSFKSILFGLILIIGSGVLLFWNEGRAVRTEQSLKEGLSNVISVSPKTREKTNNGKLIHFSGPAETQSILRDEELGVQQNALTLRRIVEVYQWKENTKSNTVEKIGGGTETTTTYTYSKEWSNQLNDSSRFKEAATHQNPITKRFEDKEWIAQQVNVGAYAIPQALIKSLNGYQPLTPTQEMLDSLTASAEADYKIVDSYIYYQTNDTTLPEIGNTRIYYESIVPQSISIVSKQTETSLAPYQTRNGGKISMIELGEYTAQEMFQSAQESSRSMTWMLRIFGVVLMFVGFKMIFSILPVIGSVIPFIGNIVGMGVSLVAGILTIIISCITIAIAWISYRPIIGISLLTVAALVYIFLLRKSKKPSIAT